MQGMSDVHHIAHFRILNLTLKIVYFSAYYSFSTRLQTQKMTNRIRQIIHQYDPITSDYKLLLSL